MKTAEVETAPPFDIKIELPALRSDFDNLREVLADVYPQLDRELDKVEESLNEVTGESPREKFNKPLNEVRKLLKKFVEEHSEYNKIIISIAKGLATLRRLERTYNKFALWLALPRVPGPAENGRNSSSTRASPGVLRSRGLTTSISHERPGL